MGAQAGFCCPQGTVMSVVWFALGALACYTAQQAVLSSGGASGGGAAAAGAALHFAGPGPALDRHHAVPCPPPAPRGAKRRNLVFAAVGDGWTADKWSFGDQASWDLVAVYYGNRTDWDCPQCTLALRMPDSMKWQMVWKLMTADSGPNKNKKLGGIWKRLRQQYQYVMVADDDLVMDACVIDTLFDAMRRHDLLAAQPSNCRGEDSDNPYWVHWQLPGMELHHVNVIEVTAPALQMDYLDSKVRPLLEHTFSGWGLPFCFSAAAGFPAGRLAAVDTVCMRHPARLPVGEKMSVSARIRDGLIKPGSIYARFAELTPFETPIQEQRAVWLHCGLTNVSAWKARQPWPPTQIVHSTVLLEGSPIAGHGSSAQAAEGAAAGQRLQALAAAGEQPPPTLHSTLSLVAQLALAAAGGAAAALWCSSRRSSKGVPPRQVVSLAVHAASPPRPRYNA